MGLKEWHGDKFLYEDDFSNILFPVDGDIFDIEGKFNTPCF